MCLRFRSLFLFTFLLFLPVTSIAQGRVAEERGQTEIAVTYVGQYSNLVSTSTFWQNGGSAEVSVQMYRGLSVVGEVAGTTTGNAAGSGNGLSLITASFGPRYTIARSIGAEQKRTLEVFGQALPGAGWGFNSFFPGTANVRTSQTSFAFQLGGGVDISLSRHLAIRPFQAEWLRTQFSNGATNVQNNLRLSAGIVLKL